MLQQGPPTAGTQRRVSKVSREEDASQGGLAHPLRTQSPMSLLPYSAFSVIS